MNSAKTNFVAGTVLSIALMALTLPASSQTQATVGDLVEYTSGFGPTLAEIVVGPDASGYVVVLLPTGKKVPVNTQKLRLVQKAGTPNASVPVGEAVSWVDADVVERGNVVKVNGNWCQVKTPSSTTMGWIECKALRGANQPAAARPAKPAPTASNPAQKPVNLKLQGNWESADGTVKLEFQGAGKCYLSLGPMTGPCTYAPSAKGVTVTFDGEDLALVANDDGSLSSSNPDAMMPIRLKRK